MHKHNNIKILRSFNAYVYVTALLTSAQACLRRKGQGRLKLLSVFGVRISDYQLSLIFLRKDGRNKRTRVKIAMRSQKKHVLLLRACDDFNAGAHAELDNVKNVNPARFVLKKRYRFR